MALFRGTRRGGIVPTQFAALCAAIVAIVVAVVAGMSLRAVRALEEEAREKNLMLLDQTRDLIDSNLGQIDRIATRLGRAASSVAFLSMGPLAPGSPELSTVIDAATELQEYRIRNDFVRAVYLYARRSGIIVSSDAVYLSPGSEYAYCIDYAGLDWAGFAGRFLSGPSRMDFAPAASMLADGSRASVILCANSLPIGIGSGSLGVALAAIDEARLEDLLGRLNGSGECAALVMDSRGVVLSSTGSPAAARLVRGLDFSQPSALLRIEAEGGEWLVAHASSRAFGLKLVSISPRDAFFTRIRRLRNAAILLGLVFAALGLGIAYVLARRTAKPFFDIEAALEPAAADRGGAGIVDRVKAGVGELLEAKDALAAAYERHLPVLRHTALRGLLEGEYAAGDELRTMLGEARLPLEGGAAYAVCVASFPGPSGAGTAGAPGAARLRELAFEEAAALAFPGSAFPCVTGPSAVALLFRLERGSEEGFPEAISAFHKSLEPGGAVLLASGGLVAGLEDVPATYRTAVRLSEYARELSVERHALVDAASLPGLPRAYAYPLELEARIISAVKAGKPAALEEALGELPAAGGLEGESTGAQCAAIAGGLEATVLRLLADLPGLEAGVAPETGPGGLESSAAALRVMARARAAALSGGDAELAASLEAYLRAHFADPALNLYMVSKAFGRKESYLYDFWKARFGETFAAGLERLRMERALGLLAEDALSVDEIAAAAGYNSSHSFRRAFKRLHGVSPAEYKGAGRA